MSKYLTEFIGTFFLVLVICCTVIGGAGNFAPLAIGSILMVMIFAGGHISGAHYNPAVTLAVLMRGKCSVADAPIYMVSQIAGGALAALVAQMILPADALNAVAAKEISHVPALIAELLGTFALCYVVLNTATSKGTEGNSFYGLAIGFTVLACAYALGGISGGAFNPAVAVGVSVAGLFSWANIWVFLVGNFAAAALAAIVFKIQNSHYDD